MRNRQNGSGALIGMQTALRWRQENMSRDPEGGRLESATSPWMIDAVATYETQPRRWVVYIRKDASSAHFWSLMGLLERQAAKATSARCYANHSLWFIGMERASFSHHHVVRQRTAVTPALQAQGNRRTRGLASQVADTGATWPTALRKGD